MPNEVLPPGEKTPENQPRPSNRNANSILAVPAPIRHLFSLFPLVTYPANALPIRAPSSRTQHSLYIFTTQDYSESGTPSFNPGCLKWQTYLRICGIKFRTVTSNNHASPSGALPFLLPASTTTGTPDPIPSSKLHKWTTAQGSAVKESSDKRYEAYLSLVDHRLRRAWLYSLYLTTNFHTVAVPLYICPTTSSSLVRLSLAHDLQLAAEAELLKTASVVDGESLYKEAEEAIAALDTLLGNNEWFFGNAGPGLFDASVFAYTHLLLDDSLGNGWSDEKLVRMVKASKALCKHRNRLLEKYY